MKIALHWLDWVVIIVYFALNIAIGLIVARRVKGTEDYFLGRRGFSVWLLIAQSFGIGTHAEMPVSLAGAVYQSGYSAIWFQWKNLFITPFYWLLGPIFRRFRRTTTGEVYEDRYGNFMGAVYVVFALAFLTFNVGAMLKGAGKLVSAATGGELSPNAVVLGMTAAFLAYSFFGGLVSSAYTNFVQSVFIILLSFMLIPLGLARIGGFSALREELPANMLSMVTPGDISVFVIAMLTVNGLIGIVSQPHQLAAVGTGRTERSCRAGMTYGNFIKRFCTVGWALVGLIVVAMLARQGVALSDREDAFGYATRELLFPGSVGLMIACVMAANMSTCSAFIVDSGALFTQNLYRRYAAPGASDRHYLSIGRWSGVIVTMLGVVFALYVDVVLEAFLFTETIAAFMGISLFAGLSWKRANRHGALASLLISSVVFFTLTRREFGAWLRWDAENFAIAMICGFAAVVVVSLATKPEHEKRLRTFYERLDTRMELDEATGEEREVREPGHDLLVVHLFNSGIMKGVGRFYRRFRVDINGLITAGAVVVGLILLAKAIFYLP
ncbi:MAG: sodium:solute symporter family protein [Bryobacteraceae bacterium]|nr:sodium:solute symporter family protein [Bryobacteraceae bacterium]